jgi:hypothetical protein
VSKIKPNGMKATLLVPGRGMEYLWSTNHEAERWEPSKHSGGGPKQKPTIKKVRVKQNRKIRKASA